jgi:shikimate O-hydroxycinnamoyltransferase
LVNWGRKTRKEPFTLPVHDRSLLKASGNTPTQEHTEFVVLKPISNTTTMNSDLPTIPSITRKIFYFSKNNLKKIHDTYSSKDPNDSWISINDALIAHIWRTVTRARGIPLGKQVVCVFYRDVRNVLNLPPNYFGNAIM